MKPLFISLIVLLTYLEDSNQRQKESSLYQHLKQLIHFRTSHYGKLQWRRSLFLTAYHQKSLA